MNLGLWCGRVKAGEWGVGLAVRVDGGNVYAVVVVAMVVVLVCERGA